MSKISSSGNTYIVIVAVAGARVLSGVAVTVTLYSPVLSAINPEIVPSDSLIESPVGSPVAFHLNDTSEIS